MKAVSPVLYQTIKELQSLESQRQAIINPYAKTTRDQSNLIQDLGGNLTNAFDNLAVATQAAEFQAEQADISLANTLDTLQASGASAGGATALAQAALASKKGIASSIEAQEANLICKDYNYQNHKEFKGNN